MSTRQAHITEAFHPDDTLRQVWADMIGRASKKAKAMGGVYAEVGHWSIEPPLDDDDECYHVALTFAVAMPGCVEGCGCNESNIMRGDE